MQTKKMSLANIQGKLSRAEMKNIMAGSGEIGYGTCEGKSPGDLCTIQNPPCQGSNGHCTTNLQCAAGC